MSAAALPTSRQEPRPGTELKVVAAWCTQWLRQRHRLRYEYFVAKSGRSRRQTERPLIARRLLLPVVTMPGLLIAIVKQRTHIARVERFRQRHGEVLADIGKVVADT